MKRTVVFCIIVNWNGHKDTAVCLDSLKKIRSKESDLRIVVVDNGSTDGSADILKKKFPAITVLETGHNLGFTGGNNVGMKFALKNGADIVWLLNNDTIVYPDVLSFVPVLLNDGVGAVGSKIYFAPGREYHAGRYGTADKGKVLWYAGGLVDWKNMYASHRGVDEVDTGQYDETEDTPFITGCSLAVRADVISRVGMLDDAYYLYLEDLDLCIRIKNAGYRIVYAPASRLWHINAGSSGRPGNPVHEYYFTRNRLLLGFRYAPLRTKFALFREALKFITRSTPIRRRAVLDFIFGRFGKQYDPKKNS